MTRLGPGKSMADKYSLLWLTTYYTLQNRTCCPAHYCYVRLTPQCCHQLLLGPIYYYSYYYSLSPLFFFFLFYFWHTDHRLINVSQFKMLYIITETLFHYVSIECIASFLYWLHGSYTDLKKHQRLGFGILVLVFKLRPINNINPTQSHQILKIMLLYM